MVQNWLDSPAFSSILIILVTASFCQSVLASKMLTLFERRYPSGFCSWSRTECYSLPGQWRRSGDKQPARQTPVSPDAANSKPAAVGERSRRQVERTSSSSSSMTRGNSSAPDPGQNAKAESHETQKPRLPSRPKAPSKQEREERHRSSNWLKSESHDSKSRSYLRHNRREKQKDFISSSR